MSRDFIEEVEAFMATPPISKDLAGLAARFDTYQEKVIPSLIDGAEKQRARIRELEAENVQLRRAEELWHAEFNGKEWLALIEERDKAEAALARKDAALEAADKVLDAILAYRIAVEDSASDKKLTDARALIAKAKEEKA